MIPREPILVAACGNPMAADDGFARRVAASLRASPLPGVEVVDLGMNPAGLVDQLDGRSVLIVVDAARCPDLPEGMLIEFDWDDPNRPRLCGEAALSSHGLGVADQIELARRLTILPAAVKLLAVNVVSVEPGGAMDVRIAGQVATAARRIRDIAATAEAQHA